MKALKLICQALKIKKLNYLGLNIKFKELQVRVPLVWFTTALIEQLVKKLQLKKSFKIKNTRIGNIKS
jgi:hypothetical protein